MGSLPGPGQPGSRDRSAGAELDAPLQQRHRRLQLGVFRADVEEHLADVNERGRKAADQGCGQGIVLQDGAPR